MRGECVTLQICKQHDISYLIQKQNIYICTKTISKNQKIKRSKDQKIKRSKDRIMIQIPGELLDWGDDERFEVLEAQVGI